MHDSSKSGWRLSERLVTPERVYLDRRRFLASTGAFAAMAGPLAGGAQAQGLGAATRNPDFDPDLALTEEKLATTYNNFYEFGSHKTIHRAAQALKTKPWQIAIDGLVEKKLTMDVDELIKKMPVEERVYRFRCVEAWSMVVPWTGFPLKELLNLARPLSSARYLQMESFEDSSVATGQRQFWYPWPYREGLTIEEAANDLAFLAIGLYGKPLPKQNGAPIRLVVPWKYGFKSAKSLVRFTFSDQRPKSFWETIAGQEYGFWANVNPNVPHARWSQAEERPLGSDAKVPTLYLNGYEEQVAHLYANIEGQSLYK